MADKKRCFVIMGFGTKTDLATGRKLDLDKSYNALIKPVVENKGHICVRADEIRHSGLIDMPMYRELLTADVVIADISTANANAFYELGLRHALRPRTTIVIAEAQLCYPFDLNHVQINKYTHLGENIDYFEVLRFQKLLGDTLDTVLQKQDPDSPIYTFLDGLVPPVLQQKAEEATQQMQDVLKAAQEKPVDEENSQHTLSFFVKQAEDAIATKQYGLAKSLFHSALLMQQCSADKKISISDSYLIHRYAYATYKSEQPNEIAALLEARQILSKLDLDHTNDSETVILAGRIEKKLFFNGHGEQHLANAVLYFERGNFLLNNRFNGINLAFLLNARVESSIYTTREDKIADTVVASRLRRRIVQKCEHDWNRLHRVNSAKEKKMLAGNDALAMGQKAQHDKELFWIAVNKAEAHFGLGEMKEYREAVAAAESVPHQPWMMNAFAEQLQTLRTLLQKHGTLLNPVWKED